MPRANIDLSWLAGLLTKTPTATPNPAYDPSQEIPYTDPLTGNTSGVQGEKMFVQPSQWQRLIHPEASSVIDTLNSKASAAYPMAQQANNVRTAVATHNLSELPDYFKIPKITDRQSALLGMGDFQEPTQIEPQIRASVGMQNGLPSTQALTDIGQAKKNLTSTIGELGRQPVEEAALDQKSVNDLSQLLHVDAATIQLNAQRLQGELGRQPTYEQVREYTINNQLNEQKNLVPAEQGAALTEAQTRGSLAHTAQGLIPYTQRQMLNTAVTGAYESGQMPVGSGYVNQVNADGTITPIVRSRTGMSPMAMQMKLANELGQSMNGMDNGVQVMTAPSGKKYAIRSQQNNAPIDVLGTHDTGSTVGNTVRTENNGDRTVNATPDVSPENFTKGATVIPPAESIMGQLNDPDFVERAKMYPNSEYGKRYRALLQQLEDLKKQREAANVSRPSVGMSRLTDTGFSFPSSLR